MNQTVMVIPLSVHNQYRGSLNLVVLLSCFFRTDLYLMTLEEGLGEIWRVLKATYVCSSSGDRDAALSEAFLVSQLTSA